MKKKLRIFLFTLLCAASYSACQRATEEKQSEESQVKIDSLRQTYVSLSDSTDAYWQILIAEEENKLDNMKAILEELSHEPIVNKERYNSLYGQLQQLYQMQLTAEDLSSEKIDRYDSASSALKRGIVEYAQNHPDIQSVPMVPSLIDSVEAADQRLLFHRVRYDNYARDYNNFLDGNRDYIRQIDTTGLSRERGLFQLSE
jgi:TolA-binding protein